ncbi:PAS domain S-box protein [Neobacillus rhizosphaerae]|uniref:PAS domain-containing sensor histidine kinase n=1 Tax=Neobacillus rhizosphaerae TaxID=2880965 RepID=UPI003D2B0A93
MNGSVAAIKSEKKLLLRHFLDDNLSRFETLFACNPDSIFTMDLEGYLVQVNPAFESLTEFSVEESLQLKLQFLFPIEDMNKVFHHFHKASFGEFQNFDCRMQNKAGKLIDLNITQIPISVENQIVGVCAIAKDITHLKRKKEEARKVEVMHHILTDNVLDIIISTNLSGEILYVSPSSEHILGYTSEELYRKNIFSFIHRDDTVRAFEDRKSVLNEHVNGRGSYRVAKKNGEYIWVEMLCKPVIDPDTHLVLEIVSVIRDITEQINTKELLLNSEKLSVAGQLAAGIAHEVRNPLTAIKGFLQLMENQLDNKTYFTIIQSEIDRIELILSELLVLAKPQDLKFEVENIITLMENVKTLINTQAIMNGVQIKTIYDSDRFTIRCDRNQLKQVFINILKNSIDAMPKGGVITVGMKQHGEGKVKIIFKDTGCGMPHHILKRIGEPFFTTKESGTGLGIMISKQIVENHRGSVHFWSDKKGTMVELILPVES